MNNKIVIIVLSVIVVILIFTTIIVFTRKCSPEKAVENLQDVSATNPWNGAKQYTITQNIKGNDVITGVTTVPNPSGGRPIVVFSAGRHTGGTCFYLEPEGKTGFKSAIPIVKGLYSGAYNYKSFILLSGDDGSSGVTSSVVYDFSTLPPKKISLSGENMTQKNITTPSPSPTNSIIVRGGYIGPILTNGPDIVLVGTNGTSGQANLYTYNNGKYDEPIVVSIVGTWMGVSVTPICNGKVLVGTRSPWSSVVDLKTPKIDSPNAIIDFKSKTVTKIPSTNQTVHVATTEDGSVILSNGGEMNIAPEQSYKLTRGKKIPIGEPTWLTRKIVPFNSSLFVVSLYPGRSPVYVENPHPHSIIKDGIDYPIPNNLLPSYYKQSEARGITIGNIFGNPDTTEVIMTYMGYSGPVPPIIYSLKNN